MNTLLMRQLTITLAIATFSVAGAAHSAKPKAQSQSAQATTLLYGSNTVASDRAQRLPQQHREDSGVSGVIESENESTPLDQRPDAESLVQVYDALRDTGRIDRGKYPENPDIPTLEEIYEFAIEKDYIKPSARSFHDDIKYLRTGVSPARRDVIGEHDIRGKQSSACVVALGICAATAAVAGGCAYSAAAGAAITAGSAAPPIWSACSTYLLPLGGSCATAAAACIFTDSTADTIGYGPVGGPKTDGDVVSSWACDQGTAAKSIKVRWGSVGSLGGVRAITSVTLVCSNGRSREFVGGTSVTSGGTQTKTCVTSADEANDTVGFMGDGLTLETGLGVVRAAGIICDDILASDNRYKTSKAGYYDSGDKEQDLSCGSGTYLVGLKTWRPNISANSDRYLRRIAVLCRGGY